MKIIGGIFLKLRNKLLRDIMTRGVVTVSINDSVKQIVKLLSNKDISGVAVIGDEGKIVGVISDMDILKVIRIENWENMTAESIMTPDDLHRREWSWNITKADWYIER